MPITLPSISFLSFTSIFSPSFRLNSLTVPVMSKDSPSDKTLSAVSCADLAKSAFLATKSVSQHNEIIEALSLFLAIATTPCEVVLSALASDFASPFFLKISIAFA